ncbi:hypothetical protein HMPREF9347_01835 [Escherichia coli MS 124-1]|uniref:Uncharacterized protein n=1 Tax=Escherichia coli MS 85-1 TaxID=679202 RepID=A0AAN3SEY4_ECOLX|nr:hypothetical protein HMPREF9347_01835 [Escherichia coli MS 124-1]EFU35199.1 hypothetical protein HMPREF9350_02943 [Escherichia coli MS 85-1]
MPLAENYAKWHRLKIFLPSCKKNLQCMMLIINVGVIMRYALWLTDVFLATYQL